MSFVTSDHEEFRSAVRRFTEEEIIPIASDLDAKNEEIPMEIITKIWLALE
mgnify:FL=1